jgi:FAD:protein FMN transferase
MKPNQTTKRRFLGASLGMGLSLSVGGASLGGASLGGATNSQAQPLIWKERALHGFGTTLWIRAAHTNERKLDLALDDAIRGIRQVESTMSLFDTSSALSRLNREGRLQNPDPQLLGLLELATSISLKSDGAFDVTVQPLWQLWHDLKQVGRTPNEAQRLAARALVDWQALQLSPELIKFDKPGMKVTLNGIAQGYAADVVRETLKAYGVEHALIDTGEWATSGRSPLNKPWSLGLADPHRFNALLSQITVQGDSVATSSDEHSFFTEDRRHHHIFDPRSGLSPPATALVCVITPSCALADALTKVLFVAPPDRALVLATQWKVKAVIVDKLGNTRSNMNLTKENA